MKFRNSFCFVFAGVPVIGYGLCAVIMVFYNIGRTPKVSETP